MIADARSFMYPRPCQQGEFIYVTSYEMMQSYPMVPGQTLFFVDVSQPFGYIRTRNYDPRLPDKIQKVNMLPIEEEPPAVTVPTPPQNEPPKYVTIEQFNDLNDKLDRLLSQNQKDNSKRNGNVKEAYKHE